MLTRALAGLDSLAAALEPESGEKLVVVFSRKDLRLFVPTLS